MKRLHKMHWIGQRVFGEERLFGIGCKIVLELTITGRGALKTLLAALGGLGAKGQWETRLRGLS